MSKVIKQNDTLVMSDAHTKIVGYAEIKFLQLASEADIAPKILAIRNINKQDYEVTMEKYPTTLLQYHDAGGDISPYKKKISELVNRLHDIDILHGDLHGNNIVINPETEEVKLIDFGRSYFMDEITPIVLKQLSKFLDKDFTSVDDVMAFEKVMYLRDM
jgi:tRNA A-37 threonylcarbamoyl transferase component Bud32